MISRTHRIVSVVVLLAVSTTVFIVAQAFADEPGSSGAEFFETTIRAQFLTKYCLKCHGADKQEAGVRYDRMRGFHVGDRHLWTKVHDKLTAGEMPPDDQPQPNPAEVTEILAWIKSQQRALKGDSIRRLNRRELSAALQDLTGLSIDYAAMLPADGKVGGFDTGADALQDSAASLTQIMEVTRRAVGGIRFTPAEGETEFIANLRESKDPRKTLESWKESGVQVKGRDPAQPEVGLLLTPRWLGERGGLEIELPVASDRDGIVKLQLVVSGEKYFEGVPNSHLAVSVGGTVVDHREATASLNEPQTLNYGSSE